MKRLAAVSLLLVGAAIPSFAGTRSCTSSMVTLGICRSTADVAMCIPLSTADPDNGGPRLAPSLLATNAVAANNGWAATMPCTAEMVTATICTAPQLGTAVAVTKAQFADMILRRWVLAQITRYRESQERATAQTMVDTEPVPDIGN